MRTSHRRDRYLMVEMGLGGSKALEPLVRRNADQIMTFIRQTCGVQHVCEEIFEQTMMDVWQRRRKYPLQCSVRTWLFRLAAKQCRSFFARHGVRNLDPQNTDPVIDDDILSLSLKCVPEG